MEANKKRGHKTLKIIGIILLILFSVAVIFFIKGKIHERRPWYDNNYFDDLRTDAVLEKKYSGRGSFETACTEFKSDNSKIDTIRVFYPAELADSNRSASGTRARNYTAVLDRIASWGFIVVGNDDPQSGTGETASQTLEYILNIGADSAAQHLAGKSDDRALCIAQMAIFVQILFTDPTGFGKCFIKDKPGVPFMNRREIRPVPGCDRNETFITIPVYLFSPVQNVPIRSYDQVTFRIIPEDQTVPDIAAGLPCTQKLREGGISGREDSAVITDQCLQERLISHFQTDVKVSLRLIDNKIRSFRKILLLRIGQDCIRLVICPLRS